MHKFLNKKIVSTTTFAAEAPLMAFFIILLVATTIMPALLPYHYGIGFLIGTLVSAVLLAVAWGAKHLEISPMKLREFNLMEIISTGSVVLAISVTAILEGIRNESFFTDMPIAIALAMLMIVAMRPLERIEPEMIKV